MSNPPDHPTPEPLDYAPREQRTPAIQFKPIPTESSTLRWVQIVSLIIVSLFVLFVACMSWFLSTLGPMSPLRSGGWTPFSNSGRARRARLLPSRMSFERRGST